MFRAYGENTYGETALEKQLCFVFLLVSAVPGAGLPEPRSTLQIRAEHGNLAELE